MRRPSLVLLAACALLVLPMACGDGGTATPRAVTTTPAPPSIATQAPAAAASASPAEPVASTAAVPTEQLPRVVFRRADGSTVALPVEVPPRAEYTIGLSGRRTLDERGMLFYYPDGVGNAGFWMSHTHVDLAIAFVTVEGVISEIHEMAAESLEITRPAEPYEFAVEAPAGWYAAHDIAPADTMRLDFDVSEFVE